MKSTPKNGTTSRSPSTKWTTQNYYKRCSSSNLKASDNSLKAFAESHLDYHHNKGLDFVARFNGKYVIGEAKFLTDRGGHQNAQLNDALATISSDANAVKVAILDGVCYIGGKNKMYTTITSERYRDCNIMSALMLRNFLYTL